VRGGIRRRAGAGATAVACARRPTALAALTALTVLAGLAVVAGPSTPAFGRTPTASPTAPPTGSSAAGDEQVPVAGTFSYAAGHDDSQPLIRGAVHAVRRVPGGTAVYYSLGVPAGQPWVPAASAPVARLQEDYRFGDAYGVALLDPAGLRLYQPMVGPDGCLCPTLADLGGDSGELHVGWAVVPPLPAGTRTVSVQLGFGTQIEDVPVEDGALRPAVGTPSTVLGEGWPELPDRTRLEAVPDPDRYVRDLVRNREDLDAGVSTAERPGRVDESLSADVLFPVDSATLNEAAQGTIAELAERVRERATGPVRIVGHTDSTGDDAYNDRLSLSRAEAVRTALAAALGDAVPLEATGRGEREPVADNATDEGRRQNRRVTVTYDLADGS
jgi:OmpA-OmpF porin, OOP family